MKSMKPIIYIVACGWLIFLLALSAPAESKTQYWEDTLTLPTYPWYDDINPVFSAYEDSIYYPYSRQDHIGKTPIPRNYRTLCLENQYLRITCIPELGGRIHSVFVKTLNREMFHCNREIKPALIAMRGAWISGGIEWNPGPHGHTVTIVSPVDARVHENEDGSATLIINNTEKMFRTRWTVSLTLHPDKTYLDESIRIYNATDSIRPFYFWNCTAFPNLEKTRFIYPMTRGTDHNGTTFFGWPIDRGRDMTQLSNYPTMSSVFGYQCEFDFFGAYDAAEDFGIVSHANHKELPGKKAWTWGKDDFGVVSQMALSDAGPVHSQYIEVQSGPLLTQSDYGMLRPGQDIRWREYWYPVHGLGDGFEYATQDAAVQTIRESNTLWVRALATADFPDARVQISRNNQVLHEETVRLNPVNSIEVRMEDAGEKPVEITLLDANGTILLRYTSPLDIPKVEAPDLTEHPARSDSVATPDELYAKAFLLHSQTSPDAAQQAYLNVLEQDPLHAPSLCGLAVLESDKGNWHTSADYATKALKRDENNGEAWYLLGAAHLQMDNSAEAEKCGYKTAFTPGHASRGYFLAGRALMRQGKIETAHDAFRKAVEANPRDTRAFAGFAAAALKQGTWSSISEQAAEQMHRDPTDYFLRAISALAENRPEQFVSELVKECGEDAFVVQEIACFLLDLNLNEKAEMLLSALLSHITDDPIVYCYLAWCKHLLGDGPAARALLNQAASLPLDGIFPSRPEALPILQYAKEICPDKPAFHLLYGYVLAGLGHVDEAAAHWQQATRLDARLSVAWRLLALHAVKRQNDPASALEYQAKAIAARPNDQILYRDQAKWLTTLKRRNEAITLVESMPKTRDIRYDIYLWLAQAYVDEQRYDDCLNLLATARFSNWEGQTLPHDIYVSALLARGRIAFEEGRIAAALQDFEQTLTFPDNLEVGARYELTDAESRYWIGKARLALSQPEEARNAWKAGANQRTLQDPPMPFIHITQTQDEHVRKCKTALELLDATPTAR